MTNDAHLLRLSCAFAVFYFLLFGKTSSVYEYLNLYTYRPFKVIKLIIYWNQHKASMEPMRPARAQRIVDPNRCGHRRVCERAQGEAIKSST